MRPLENEGSAEARSEPVSKPVPVLHTIAIPHLPPCEYGHLNVCVSQAHARNHKCNAEARSI